MSSTPEQDGFTDVGKLRTFPSGRGWAYDLDGVKVAVFKTDDGYAAITDTCPHMGTSLADGDVCDGEVECPWHEWKYDLRTGKSDQREWAFVDVFEVRVENGRVYLKAPPPKPEAKEPEPAKREDDDWIEWDEDKFFKKKTE